MDNNAINMFNTLLSNPDAMDSIRDMLKNFSNESSYEKISKGEESRTENAGNNTDLSFITDFLTKTQNSELLHKISNAYNAYTDNSSPGIGLLDALSPYLNNNRSANLQKVKNVIRIANAFSELNKKL